MNNSTIYFLNIFNNTYNEIQQAAILLAFCLLVTYMFALRPMSLPPFISSSPSLPVFKRILKTELFTRSYMTLNTDQT